MKENVKPNHDECKRRIDKDTNNLGIYLENIFVEPIMPHKKAFECCNKRDRNERESKGWKDINHVA